MGKKQTSISIDEAVYDEAYKLHRFWDYDNFSELVETLLREWLKCHKVSDII